MVNDWVWVDVFPQVNILVEVDNEFLVFERIDKLSEVVLGSFWIASDSMRVILAFSLF